MRKILIMIMTALAVMALTATSAVAVPPTEDDETAVPGHRDKESGTVMGVYDSIFAYEGEYGDGASPEGDWYWDLGDGRPGNPYGTVDSVDDLDKATLTVCDYTVMYQGDFGDDPYLDTGWIRNNVRCSGYDDNGTYNSLFIHKSDPRYTGDRESIWGTWEIMVDTASGQGNLARPENHVG